MARILIVGGSLGGLFAANLLLRAGHDVTLLEKSASSLDGRGAGIVTHPPLLDALRRAGAKIDASLGVRVEQRRVLGRSGAVEATLDMPQILTSWGRLYQILRDLLPDVRYRFGAEVIEVRESPSAIVAHCASGAEFEGDLLIASDGLRSSVRGLVAPHVQPSYAGYVAWRGVCDESALSAHTLATLFGYFGFCLPAGEQMLGYPVAGPENCTAHGRRRYNFVWYRAAPEGESLNALLTDEQGRVHPTGIPPNRVTAANTERMRDDARRLLAPQFVEIIEKTEHPFLQPICDVASTQLAYGRIALVGDAAFVARPHLGMGVTKAAEDAVALAEAIGQFGATASAIRAYQDARLETGRGIVFRARELGAYMQAQGDRAGSSSDEVRRDARQVLLDTAVDFRTHPSARPPRAEVEAS